MGKAYSHGSLLEQKQEGKVTAVNSQKNMLSGESIHFDTYTQTAGWWLWKSDYLYVQNSSDDSMSTLIYDALPN